MRIDEPNKIIITWTHNMVSFNHLRGRKSVAEGIVSALVYQPGDLIVQIRDITETDEKITDVLVFSDYRYFVTSTNEGNICVWKYEKASNSQGEGTKKLIHIFQGHIKSIKSLQHFNKNSNVFLSASKDGTFKVWSIETLSLLYTFEFPSIFTFVTVMAGSQFIVTQNDR